MEEEVVIILVPKRVALKSNEASPDYTMHVIGGELTRKQKAQLLRSVLEGLRED